MGIRYIKIILSVILLILGISAGKSSPTLSIESIWYSASANYSPDTCNIDNRIPFAEVITDGSALGKHPLSRPSGSLKTQIPFCKITDVSLFFRSIAKHICLLENMLTENKAKIFNPDIKYIPQPANLYYIYTLRQIII